MDNISADYKEKQKNRLEEGLKKQEKSLTGFFIRNYRFTYLIIATNILFGGYSLLALPREASPEVKIPFAVVTTIYPGATPVDTEELVTDKIEDRVKNLDNLKQYTSS